MRRDHGNLRGRTANSVVPTLLSSISLGRGGGGGGGFTGRNFVFTVYITAKAFSYPHTEFGALRSRRLALKCVTNEIFLVTLACLDISSKKMCL